jgi:hypothetical protein
MFNAVKIRAGGEIVLGQPKPLFRLGTSPPAGFAPSADGQRFLVDDFAQPASHQPSELTVVVNWPAEVGQALSLGKAN